MGRIVGSTNPDEETRIIAGNALVHWFQWCYRTLMVTGLCIVALSFSFGCSSDWGSKACLSEAQCPPNWSCKANQCVETATSSTESSTDASQPEEPSSENAPDSGEAPSLLSASWEAGACKWKPSFQLKGHTSQVFRMAFNTRSLRLIVSAKDGSIRQWELASGQPDDKQWLSAHSAPVSGLAFHPGAKGMFLSGDKSGNVKLWSVTSSNQVNAMKMHNADVNTLVFHPDLPIFASCSDDKTVALWRTSYTPLPHQKLWKLTLQSVPESMDMIGAQEFGKEGAILGVGQVNGSISVLGLARSDTYTAKTLYEQKFTMPGGLSRFRLHPTKPYWVAGTEQGEVLFHPNYRDDKTEPIRIRAHQSKITSIQFDPLGEYLVVIGKRGTENLKIWNVADLVAAQKLEAPKPMFAATHSKDLNRVAFSPNGKIFAIGDMDGLVQVWKCEN